MIVITNKDKMSFIDAVADYLDELSDKIELGDKLKFGLNSEGKLYARTYVKFKPYQCIGPKGIVWNINPEDFAKLLSLGNEVEWETITITPDDRKEAEHEEKVGFKFVCKGIGVRIKLNTSTCSESGITEIMFRS